MMPTLLRVDSSPMLQSSVSRRLTEEFVRRWGAIHADGKLIARDLSKTELAPVTEQWVGAAYTPEKGRSPEQRQLLTVSDSMVAELEAADEYVIGVPMHNFGIPSTLKLWIDLISRAGRTFAYVDGRPKGLLQGKRATFLVASGGKYDAGTALASFNFVEPYLHTVFAFLGVTDTTFINAGGTAALRSGGVAPEAFLQPYVEAVTSRVAKADFAFAVRAEAAGHAERGATAPNLLAAPVGRCGRASLAGEGRALCSARLRVDARRWTEQTGII